MDPIACLIGASATIRELGHDLELAARSSANVLITGESGVGKKLLAEFIYQQGRPVHRPFVTLNCAHLSEGQLRFQLCGNLRETADGGTLFIGAISEMAPADQDVLLELIETGEIECTGVESPPWAAGMRVLASTRPGLAKRVAAGDFREDLYYHLNTIHLYVPPVRERRGDIPDLVSYFLRLHAANRGRHAPDVSSEAMRRLVSYDWPGNVAELKRVAGVLVSEGRSGTVIRPEHLPAGIPTSDVIPGRASGSSTVIVDLSAEPQSLLEFAPETRPDDQRMSSGGALTHFVVSLRQLRASAAAAWSLIVAGAARVHSRANATWTMPFGCGAVAGGVIVFLVIGMPSRRGMTDERAIAEPMSAPRLVEAAVAPVRPQAVSDAARLEQIAATTGIFESEASPVMQMRSAASSRFVSFRGSLAVTSRPSGAQVLLNGRPAGRTPLVLRNLPVGSRAVRVELATYAPWSSAVRVVANQRARLTIDLRPRSVETPSAAPAGL